MAIDRKTVEHVARLARLELADDEVELLASQLARILDYVDKLNELDVSKDEPMAHAAEGALLRDDSVKESLPRKAALDGAPASADGFFIVPPVIEDAGGGG